VTFAGDKQGSGSVLTEPKASAVALNANKVSAFLERHANDSNTNVPELVATFLKFPSLLAEMSKLLEVGDGSSTTSAGAAKKTKFGMLKKKKVNAPGGTVELAPGVLAEVMKQSSMAGKRWCDQMFATHFLGNSLSIYWYARALAMLAGVPFKAPCAKAYSWINLLPQKHTPDPAEASAEKLTAMIRKCSVYRPHECTLGWTEPALHKLIKKESDNALAKHMKEAKVR
jgi:hypothetical protein